MPLLFFGEWKTHRNHMIRQLTSDTNYLHLNENSPRFLMGIQCRQFYSFDDDGNGDDGGCDAIVFARSRQFNKDIQIPNFRTHKIMKAKLKYHFSWWCYTLNWLCRDEFILFSFVSFFFHLSLWKWQYSIVISLKWKHLCLILCRFKG